MALESPLRTKHSHIHTQKQRPSQTKTRYYKILLYNKHTKVHKLINPPGQAVRSRGRSQSWFCLTQKLMFFSFPGVLFFSPQKSFVSRLSALTTELFDFKVGSAFWSLLKKSQPGKHTHYMPTIWGPGLAMNNGITFPFSRWPYGRRKDTIKIAVYSLKSHWILWAKAFCLLMFHMARISENSLLLQHRSVFIFFS